MGKYLVMSCTNGEALLAPWNLSWKEYAGWRYCEIQFDSDREYQKFMDQLRQKWTPEVSMGIKPKNFMPKAVFSDVDATLIPCESIEKLAEVKGCLDEVRNITSLAMEGELDFKQALDARLKLIEGLELERIQAIAQDLEPYPQVPEFVSWCHGNGIAFHMVSGGFIQMLTILAEKLGVEHVHTNNLEFHNHKMTGQLIGAIVDAAEKRSWMLKRTKELSISSDEVLAIGDGANDLPMIKEAGLSVGFRPKPILYPHISILNNTGSHEFHWKLLSLESH